MSHDQFKKGTNTPDYTWVITWANPEVFPGMEQAEEIGTAGPYGTTDEMVAYAKKHGETFKMYDDDGEHYYTGKIVHFAEGQTEEGFEPLSDYGTANAGATEIRYKNPKTGKFETL